MPAADALRQFQEAYLAAADADERLAAIWHYRAGHPHPPGDSDPALLRSLIGTLLNHAVQDAPDARLAAARLLRSLWRDLSRETVDEVFQDVTLLLLRRCPALGEGERAVLWEAIEGGFASASPTAVERFCRELIAGGADRSLPPFPLPHGRPGPQSLGAANLDMFRLVVKYASRDLWPSIARDLWMLFSVDVRPIMRLESTAFWQEIGRGMLRRTLQELQPSDLKDAAPRFLRWVEDLSHTTLPQDELEPLLPALVAWPVAAIARALERWSTVWWFSREFRGEAGHAAAAIRAALGTLGTEVMAGEMAPGTGSEPSPATAPLSPVASSCVPRPMREV
jgi:hypothetical protein